jgi:hypothetical protein
MEKYDFRIGEWERMPPMFHERADFISLSSQPSKSIYIFSGCFQEDQSLLIEKFDCRSEVWVILSLKLPLKINKFHHL